MKFHVGKEKAVAVESFPSTPAPKPIGVWAVQVEVDGAHVNTEQDFDSEAAAVAFARDALAHGFQAKRGGTLYLYSPSRISAVVVSQKETKS